MKMKRSIIAVALASLVPAGANAFPITEFSLFGGNSTSLGNSVIVNSGLVGSNASVTVGGGADTLTVLGAGVLSLGNTVTSSGDIIFNGNVTTGGGSIVTGDIDSGGNVSLGNTATVSGNVRAGGTVALGGSAQVLGNVDAGRTTPGVAITLGNSAKVIGTATHNAGTTINFGGGSSVGANVIGIPAAPTPYVATVLPTPTVFVSGVTDVSTAGGATTNLAPGSYDDVILGATNTLNLISGTYILDRWTMGGGSTINVDLTSGSGQLKLFFTGNVNLGNTLNFNVTGGDASDIYAETYGDWTLGGGGDWMGTIFGATAGATAATRSDIHFGNSCSLTGALYSLGNVEVDGACTVNLLAADYLTPTPPVTPEPTVVPEPATLALLGFGLAGLATRRRRKGVA